MLVALAVASSAAAQAVPVTHEVTFEGTVSFAGDPVWPVVVVIAGSDRSTVNDVAASFEFDQTEDPITLVAQVPAGNWSIRTRTDWDALRNGGHWEAMGPVFRVDDLAGITCLMFCDRTDLFHPLFMHLDTPTAEKTVTEPRPVLRWSAVPGAVEYRVTWFENSYTARSIATGQMIPTKAPEYRFEQDLVPERRYEWTVEARDADQRTIARSEHRSLYTRGADPGKFRLLPADAEPGGWLGVQLDSDANGVFVRAVGPDSPAFVAGFEAGDYLVRFGDRDVTTLDVVQWVQASKPGSSVDISVSRGGKIMTLQTVLGDRESP